MQELAISYLWRRRHAFFVLACLAFQRVWARLEELVDEWEQQYFGVVSLVILRIEFQEIGEALGVGLF
jgi:hypothetical protein